MWVIRSRTIIGRTGSTKAPSSCLTFTVPKEGMYRATGSISRKRPSSNRLISATQMIGLVIE